MNLVLFFFFKQKTAYEMRISDWSSDVCSSDLSPRQRPRRRQLATHRRDCHRHQQSQVTRSRNGGSRSACSPVTPTPIAASRSGGRASCTPTSRSSDSRGDPPIGCCEVITRVANQNGSTSERGRVGNACRSRGAQGQSKK